MILINASPFTPVQQSILTGFIFWGIFTFFIYGTLWAFDKMYKEKYFDKNFYELKRTKYFFSYYEIKKGKITKHIFWLNIVAHILVLTSLSFNTAYAFNQNRLNSFISGILTFIGLLTFILIITIFGQIYKSKLKKTMKKL